MVSTLRLPVYLLYLPTGITLSPWSSSPPTDFLYQFHLPPPCIVCTNIVLFDSLGYRAASFSDEELEAAADVDSPPLPTTFILSPLDEMHHTLAYIKSLIPTTIITH
ncbi:hypothetical protein Tco_1256293 [Tanacetum coccineum]